MRIISASTFLLATTMAAAAACDLTTLKARYERAMEPLDHAHMFQDIDPREVDAELTRHFIRLQALIEAPPPGCEEDAAAARILGHASDLRVGAVKRMWTVSYPADQPADAGESLASIVAERPK